MKLSCSLFCMVFVCALTLSTAVTAQTVSSVNIVGFNRVDIPGNDQLRLVAPVFLNGSNTVTNTVFTLDALLGTNNLTANWDSSHASVVYLWIDFTYKAVWLNDGGWSNPDVDYKWCYDNGGTPVACAGTYDVALGSGFWLKTRGSSTNTLFSGDVVAAPTMEVGLSNGLCLIANPYSVGQNLDDMISTNDGAVANWNSSMSDGVYIWNNGTYLTAWLNDGAWSDPNIDFRWCYDNGGIPVPCVSNDLYKIDAGEGFWYKRRGSSTNWIADRPYSVD